MPAEHEMRSVAVAGQTRTADGRKRALTVLVVLITLITCLQVAIYAGVLDFYLAYVVPPFAALVATFICALINLLFHRFFEKHHLRVLYFTTSLPFFFFAAAILAHFFEDTRYQIPATIIGVCSLIWYAYLLRLVARTSNIES